MESWPASKVGKMTNKSSECFDPKKKGDCTAILDRLDSTGWSVNLWNLPKPCQDRFPIESSTHITMRRRNSMDYVSARRREPRHVRGE